MSACKYRLADHLTAENTAEPMLISSVVLRGQAAQQAMAAIATAPVGGGPNSPESCTPEVSYGSEAIVLRVISRHGESQIYMHYNGCDHHGFDDGVALRTLTRPAVAPFIAGANTPWMGSGGAVGEIIWPDQPVKR